MENELKSIEKTIDRIVLGGLSFITGFGFSSAVFEGNMDAVYFVILVWLWLWIFYEIKYWVKFLKIKFSTTKPLDKMKMLFYKNRKIKSRN